jgi:ABC-2 type transport system ATP-binding protein
MIEARDLTKVYAGKVAVDHLSFTVQPGRVTGFLGPNGAGKSTTMRLILGLDRPDSGSATIDGKRYTELANPLRTVGALLEAKSVHGGRSAANHLLFLAQSQGLPKSRVEEVLDLVGLRDVAGKRAGTFSLGMSQRLGIAAAMLGDPQFLLLDEPVNGLDPEGVLWIRNFMKFLAGQGRTILVSSHLMNEMAVTADHLIVIGRGKLIADSTTGDIIARGSEQSVRVRTPEPARLSALIEAEGGKVVAGAQNQSPGEQLLSNQGPGSQDPSSRRPGDQGPPDQKPVDQRPAGQEPAAPAGWDSAETLTVTGMPAPRIGELAASGSIVLHELSPQLASLEEAFMELTAGSLEFGEHGTNSATSAAGSAR